MTPQLILTLSPAGDLQIELPGANGSRRVVQVEGIDQLRRILYAQLHGERGIGSESEPTEAALRHWRDHKRKYDERCAFCRAERVQRAQIAGRQTVNILKELNLL